MAEAPAPGPRTAPSIVVLGSANVDLVTTVERFPAPGETVLTASYTLHLGGKGANQAVATARLGARAALIGCVGEDDHGARLRAGLTADGVDTRWLRSSPSPTGVAFIQVDASGQNEIVVASGANLEVTAEDLPVSVIGAADALLLQLELPLATVLAGARVAREHGVMVVLNLAPARALAREQLADVDVLLLNEVEAASLAGTADRQGLAGPERLARALTGLVPRIVITLGADGAVWAARQEDVVNSGACPAFRVDVVDTTGAGDAFAGALTTHLAGSRGATLGAALGAAVRFASAAGALAATREGAQPSLPTAAEVAGLLSRASA